MKLLKNTIMFNMKLPTASDFEKAIQGSQFSEISDGAARSVGFYPIPQTNELVSGFDGGYAFCIRVDEKVIPSSAVKVELKKLVEVVEKRQGYKVGRKYMSELREEVIFTLIGKAIAKTSTVTCYFDTKNETLYVPVSSMKRAADVTSLLIQALGSVRTSTIWLSGLTGSLTNRLHGYFKGDDFEEGEAFGDMEPCDEVYLSKGSERLTAKLKGLDNLDRGLLQALDSDFRVIALRLYYIGVTFKLTEDFHLRQIKMEDASEQLDEGDEYEKWQHQSATEVYVVSTVVKELCNLFGYEPTWGDDDKQDPAEGL